MRLILSIIWALAHPHVLYCMNNETGERVEWGDYWAKYVRRKAEAAGVEIYVTDMRRNENVRSSDHAHIFDHPELYTFVDISQNNAWAGLGQESTSSGITAQTEVIEKLRCAKRTSILGKLTGRAWDVRLPLRERDPSGRNNLFASPSYAHYETSESRL
jgi:hypothetical protein